jgi:hypothetical protein
MPTEIVDERDDKEASGCDSTIASCPTFFETNPGRIFSQTAYGRVRLEVSSKKKLVNIRLKGRKVPKFSRASRLSLRVG